MTIEIIKNENEIIIEVEGRLDTNTAPTLEKSINENTEEKNNLVLDLKKLEYISSAGLRVLLSAQKKMNKNGSMKVKNVSEDVMADRKSVV